jgi:hypothetical protein
VTVASVAALHTYIVGAERVWVHNGNCSLKGPVVDFRRQLTASQKAPKWMNQWLREGRFPTGRQGDHLFPRSIGGKDKAENLRLRTTADYINRHRSYRPWNK